MTFIDMSIKSSLHLWNKINLMHFLVSVCGLQGLLFFFSIFASMFIKDMGLKFFFIIVVVVVFLLGFGIREILAS